ncbi:MAG TPA: carboxypeptidase regulatory-like domain-containing protein [Candidatus Acidoferrales bacterium]|nr:carboxypeptidase regulatory-like domain-containing protein [Candidatus Acidoferrales bacterium]
MRANLLSRALVGTVLLVVPLVGFLRAKTPSAAGHVALSGKVTSRAEGAMEGVIVGAKKEGSTITTWVVSDAQGRYAFPRERMDPGKYAIRVRAAGYELPNTTVEVTPEPAHVDLQLDKITVNSKFVGQMSNGELLMSLPGTPEQKAYLGNCVNCHTLQKVLFSHYNAEAMVPVVQRMAMHTNNSSPTHPWMRPPKPMTPPTERQVAAAKYFSTINLSSQDTFDFPLKTLPRPTGKASQVIYTTYDLPRPDAAPHDVAIDAQGTIWYSDFDSQFLGKVDPKTGKVTEYPVPLARTGPYAQGGLQIAFDKQGRVYFGNMSQMQVVRFDPKTEKMECFKPPISDKNIGDAHLTMIDASQMQVDGKIWVNVADGTDESGGTWHVDLATNTWTQVTYPAGSPSARAYDVIADSNNNMYGMSFTNPRIWMTDGKTLKTTWYDMPAGETGCRRGHIDSQNRVWCGGFNGNDLVMFDPKTQKITAWKAPTPWTRPYDAEFDDKTYDWGAGMDNDIALRLNTKTGEFTEYLLPHETNVRHVEVQKTGALSSMWLGDQHGGTIIHIEPLAP